ncbi:DUF4349 domain-containing protein [Altererythrobacter aquiaggeris]|uniref:DUF4349 domain-containing protein n=1 Tax=Aestuarierythrobacter aquiaggeris TaxID=1898396 RepID=UPI0030177BA2
MPVSAPKIAYIYDYGFRISAEEIAPLQQKHADMCEAMGPTSCQILSLSQTGSEGAYAGGELRLAVASPRARDFGAKLSAEAEGRGGEQVSASIQGEDLSKAIVDTEARLRARTVLRDRLMEVLETRRGTVAELVEAERGVAQVNEEIDQARSWLSEMKTRVAFSRVNIAYRSGTPETGGFFDPIRSAFGSIGSILGVMVAALIVLLAIGLPIAAIIAAILWGRRRYTSDQDEPIEAEVMPKSDSSA